MRYTEKIGNISMNTSLVKQVEELPFDCQNRIWANVTHARIQTTRKLLPPHYAPRAPGVYLKILSDALMHGIPLHPVELGFHPVELGSPQENVQKYFHGEVDLNLEVKQSQTRMLYNWYETNIDRRVRCYSRTETGRWQRDLPRPRTPSHD